MGRKNRLREARRQEADTKVFFILQQHSRKAPETVISDCWGFSSERCGAIRAHAQHALRSREDWRCRVKSRSADRRFIDLVRFVFAKYSVARHLENAWIEPETSKVPGLG